MESIAIERKNQKKLSRRLKSMKTQSKVASTKPKKKNQDTVKKETGVIYLGHIPHGFYEDEIKEYCSQFGRVTRVRVARSKRTGRSKGYAFVEFYHSEVAKIVAETIDNYLMFNRILKCHYIPPEKRHRKMFWNIITQYKYPAQKNKETDTNRKNAVMDSDKEEERKKKTRRKIEDFKKFFEERGIEFNFKVNDPNDDISLQVTKTPAVLEIDESDDEIEFNTPPHVMKVYKKATKTPEPKKKSAVEKSLKKEKFKENKGSGVLGVSKTSKTIAKKGITNLKNVLSGKQKIRH